MDNVGSRVVQSRDEEKGEAPQGTGFNRPRHRSLPKRASPTERT
jgi:hypothetical protein